MHNKSESEAINNESYQKELKKTAAQDTAQVGQPTKVAFILHQVINKTDRPFAPQMVELVPIVCAQVRTGLDNAWPKDAQVLLNSGASSSIISHKLVKNLCIKDSTTQESTGLN